MLEVYRTIEEYSAPFKSGTKVTNAGLRLVSIETKTTRCPYHTAWLKERGDSKKHAKKYVNSFRVWSNHSFYSGILNFVMSKNKMLMVSNDTLRNPFYNGLHCENI